MLFKKPIGYSRSDLGTRNLATNRIYHLMKGTENNSALDYYYWNNTLLYFSANKIYGSDFEKNFQNAVILSRKNADTSLALRLYFLRNIGRFSQETKKIILLDK